MLAPAARTEARVRKHGPAPRTRPTRYARTFDIRWADLDPNGHLRHSAYGDYGTHVRLAILEENGYPLSRFQQERFGAVIFREETRFKREVHIGERITVDFRVGAVSECGRKWTVHHHVFKETGKLAAILTLDGGWFHLDKRRLMRPTEELHAVMQKIENDWDAGSEPAS